MLRRFQALKTLPESIFMNTFRLSARIQEDFSHWIQSHNMSQEEKETLRQRLLIQSEILLTREDLKSAERRYLESIIRILE